MSSPWRTLFDGLIVAGSVLFIGWATVAGPVVRADTGSLVVIAIVVFVLIGLVAVVRGRSAAVRPDDRRPGRASVLAPYAPFLVAVAVAGVVQVTRGALEPFLFWNAVVVVLCVAARQMLALNDYLTLNQDLEERVQARTAELEHTLSELEESHRLQEQFVRNVSHELRTPLSIILGATHLLSNEDLSRQGATTVGLANKASVHLRRLVEDLLLASGLADMVTCARDPFDARRQIEEAVATFAGNPKPIHTQIRGALVGVGDAEHFGHIVRHLVSNALKHAPPGTEVSVSGYEEDGKVHCVVSDEGPGVPQHLREKIFHSFFQVDGTPTRLHTGMGLGLYLARALAHAMGGEVLLDDTQRGASFRIRLPAAAIAVPAQPAPRAGGQALGIARAG